LTKVRKFGSAARAADGIGLDLTLEAGPATSRLELMKAQRGLENALGVRVNLLMKAEPYLSVRWASEAATLRCVTCGPGETVTAPVVTAKRNDARLTPTGRALPPALRLKR
jgi:predicted nucleotidyltransferase